MTKFCTITLLLAVLASLAIGGTALAQEVDRSDAERLAARAEIERIAAEQALAATEGRTLADWYGMGGFIMHGLLVCSVLVVALVLERSWTLRRNRIIPRKFMQSVMEPWENREIAKVVGLCGSSNNSMSPPKP